MSSQEKVLAILEKNRSAYISGQAIAGTLGLSRSSVWKAITGLREAGYRIESATNRGYRLSPETDILSAASLTPFLKDPSLAEHIEFYPTLDSTNTFLKAKALDGARSPHVVLAEEQTGGRGRMGRSFYSPPGTGIYLSILLRPTLTLDQSLFITIAASVLIRRAIKTVTGLDTSIKWVNDLYFKGKKICGILTEASGDFETGTVDHVVLGAGINLALPQEGFPQGLQPVAGSLLHKTDSGDLRSHLAAEIINHLATLSSPVDTGAIMAEYRAHSMVLGHRVTLKSGADTFFGTVEAIDDSGHLVLLKEDGTKMTITSGEVSLRLG